MALHQQDKFIDLLFADWRRLFKDRCLKYQQISRMEVVYEQGRSPERWHLVVFVHLSSLRRLITLLGDLVFFWHSDFQFQLIYLERLESAPTNDSKCLSNAHQTLSS